MLAIDWFGIFRSSEAARHPNAVTVATTFVHPLELGLSSPVSTFIRLRGQWSEYRPLKSPADLDRRFGSILARR
jgi:hypothetical protein